MLVFQVSSQAFCYPVKSSFFVSCFVLYKSTSSRFSWMLCFLIVDLLPENSVLLFISLIKSIVIEPGFHCCFWVQNFTSNTFSLFILKKSKGSNPTSPRFWLFVLLLLGGDFFLCLNITKPLAVVVKDISTAHRCLKNWGGCSGTIHYNTSSKGSGVNRALNPICYAWDVKLISHTSCYTSSTLHYHRIYFCIVFQSCAILFHFHTTQSIFVSVF